MVMKDKLVKNHHKGMYYRMRKATLVILASFTFAAAIVVPTYISATSHRNATTGYAAEKGSEQENSEVVENENESENSQYEEYISK